VTVKDFNDYSAGKTGYNPPIEQPPETYWFVRDGVPWLWEPSKQDWRPITETKYAERYAAMQKRAS
jgi:hypothetical protein